MKNVIHRIAQSKKLQFTLFAGLVIQIIFCYTSVGYFHPDQHFQIIEFSSFQLKEGNATSYIWELSSNIRPTLQVYLFSLFKLSCKAVSINNPFYQLTILRFLQGITFFVVFNLITFYYCRSKSNKVLLITISLLNFSWFLPYSRTLFSSEILSALVFFPSLVFFHRCYLSDKRTTFNSIVTGFLLSLSFFLRFQIAFALIGFTLWVLIFEKQYKLSLFILIGFAMGMATNVFLDFNFYQKFVFTPYLYFKVNILDGVAASFGKQSFILYVGVLIALVGAPLISVVLLLQYAKTSIQKIKHPLVISTLAFIVCHCVVAHKEDRFMFTIISIIPILLAIDNNAFTYFVTSYRYKNVIRPILIFSVVINFMLLFLFIFNPYSQTIHFDEILSRRTSQNSAKIYCYQRSPLETESRLPLVYYSKGLGNVDFITIRNIDSLTKTNSGPIWLTSTFNDIKDDFSTVHSLGYKPQQYSSLMLWSINTFLLGKKINTINDIWVLYKLER